MVAVVLVTAVRVYVGGVSVLLSVIVRVTIVEPDDRNHPLLLGFDTVRRDPIQIRDNFEGQRIVQIIFPMIDETDMDPPATPIPIRQELDAGMFQGGQFSRATKIVHGRQPIGNPRPEQFLQKFQIGDKPFDRLRDMKQFRA